MKSIIIPVYKDSQGLKRTLESLRIIKGAREDIEIIVCNDGGGDSISKVTMDYNVREEKSIENKGSYAARNMGIKAAKGDIISFLDADQKVDDQWLEEGVASLKNADYAGGRIIVETGPEPSVWAVFDALTAFPVEKYLKESHFAPTASLFVRREILDKAGFFREELRSGGDFEFGQRVFAGGFKQAYAEKAITWHPARNKIDQDKKARRVGEGQADLFCLVYHKSPFVEVLRALLIILKIPFEALWRLISSPFVSGAQNLIPRPIFIIMDKRRKLYHHWFCVMRSLYWLTKIKS